MFSLISLSSILCFLCCYSDGYEVNFDLNVERRMCGNLPIWHKLRDSSTDSDQSMGEIISPISGELSCVSTHDFSLARGVIEAVVYMKSTSENDRVSLLVYEVNSEENDVIVGRKDVFSSSPNFINGSQMLEIDIKVINANGYVVLMGQASKSSSVTLESIRFLPYHSPEILEYIDTNKLVEIGKQNSYRTVLSENAESTTEPSALFTTIVTVPFPAVNDTTTNTTLVTIPLPTVSGIPTPAPNTTIVTVPIPTVSGIPTPAPNTTIVTVPVPTVSGVPTPPPNTTLVTIPLPTVSGIPTTPPTNTTIVTVPVPTVSGVPTPSPNTTIVTVPVPTVSGIPTPEVTTYPTTTETPPDGTEGLGPFLIVIISLASICVVVLIAFLIWRCTASGKSLEIQSTLNRGDDLPNLVTTSKTYNRDNTNV